jgi:hypothetical protein
MNRNGYRDINSIPGKSTIEKTGDLTRDTQHIEITVEKHEIQGKTVYIASDQYGNTSGNYRKPENAEQDLRAWHDVAY